jgi:hypothetical protein
MSHGHFLCAVLHILVTSLLCRVLIGLLHFNLKKVNAEKVAVSGKKRTQKLYRRHSGRPGGMKVETFDQLQQRIPERIIEHAVRGMLPKGRVSLIQVKLYACLYNFFYFYYMLNKKLLKLGFTYNSTGFIRIVYQLDVLC